MAILRCCRSIGEDSILVFCFAPQPRVLPGGPCSKRLRARWSYGSSGVSVRAVSLSRASQKKGTHVGNVPPLAPSATAEPHPGQVFAYPAKAQPRPSLPTLLKRV